MIIQGILLGFTLDKYWGILLSLAAVLSVFMNFSIPNLFNISIPSALKNSLPFWEGLTTPSITNKLTLIAFSESYLRVSLKFATNKLIINCLCLNPFDEITSVNGIVLRGQFDILSIWYTLPYNSHSWRFLWSWELASLSPSAPGMFVFFLAHKNFSWLTAHSNFTNHKEETFSFRIL